MLTASATPNLTTLAYSELGFSLAADGTLSVRVFEQQPDPITSVYDARRLPLVGLITFADDGGESCELWLGDQIIHTSRHGFELEPISYPFRSMSLVDLDDNKPLYYSHGGDWRPYSAVWPPYEEGGSTPDLSGPSLELRSTHCLSALVSSGRPRLRPSGLAERTA
jgi:hypothetical protein